MQTEFLLPGLPWALKRAQALPILPPLRGHVHTTALTQTEVKSPFYLMAWEGFKAVGSTWYKEQRMGLRSLKGVVPRLAKELRLEHCGNSTPSLRLPGSLSVLAPTSNCPLSALTSQHSKKGLCPGALLWCEEGELLSNKNNRWKDRTLRFHFGNDYGLVLKSRGAEVSTTAMSPKQRGGGDLFPL